jgi:hypothetical protein
VSNFKNVIADAAPARDERLWPSIALSGRGFILGRAIQKVATPSGVQFSSNSQTFAGCTQS